MQLSAYKSNHATIIWSIAIQQVELATVRVVGLTEEFEAVTAPFALHHDRQTIDDNVQEAADDQPQSE